MDNESWLGFRSNSTMPNLVYHPKQGAPIDVTASLAAIELGYGSKTNCTTAEAFKRRQQKERLKTLVLAYIFGADLSAEERSTCTIWLRPAISAQEAGAEYRYGAVND